MVSMFLCCRWPVHTDILNRIRWLPDINDTIKDFVFRFCDECRHFTTVTSSVKLILIAILYSYKLFHQDITCVRASIITGSRSSKGCAFEVCCCLNLPNKSGNQPKAARRQHCMVTQRSQIHVAFLTGIFLEYINRSDKSRRLVFEATMWWWNLTCPTCSCNGSV